MEVGVGDEEAEVGAVEGQENVVVWGVDAQAAADGVGFDEADHIAW